MNLNILIFLIGLFLWIVTYFNYKFKRIKSEIALLGSSSSLVLMFFSIFPQLAFQIAKFFNVSRATDLFIYIAIPFLFYIFILLYAKVKDLEDKIVNLAEELAIDDFKNRYKFKIISKKKQKDSAKYSLTENFK
ncbi:MAG: DUF2304 domain-containing protein [Candidatus Woesearchaeota archaeon]